ncbi:DUF1015 domain-containing protein [Faecalibacterium gallinarum]|uniref:DUF1015 domain-containing protein n=1 Tax=Faecalibacterium gallinarum TaxID=2903556 RepID=A0AA37J143_9FIRM|nr:DUF1015 domain-containing protein [Faecalibacterium gallinarum]GJN65292.1 hypothetical protein JCM17207_19170 [Faecalibacterium gallinarum]
MKKTSCFLPAHILLPSREIPLEQWGCVACDQFTSDRSYWEKAAALVGDGPSALQIVLPEVYLTSADLARRIDRIHKTMNQYAQSVLTRSVDGFIYVERTEQSGRIRQGLVGRVDLEAYSYQRGRLPEVRPSENTVEERLPPRLAVRRGACLESPHVMMLADDPEQTLIEPIAARKDSLRKVYEGELMLGGGHIAGWAVEEPALIERIVSALDALGSQEAFDRKYPAVRGSKPLTLAVGDGNHSLATAKAYWEELKKTLPPEQQKTHPARWCLAEVCNIHSEAIEIEPVHRVLYNATLESVLLSLATWSSENMAGLCFGAGSEQHFRLVSPRDESELSFETPTAPLTVGTVDEFIEYHLEHHPECSVDYVHDEPAVRALCKEGAVGLLMPPFEKSDLFKGVVMGGVLPRKTFSMGHAEEKRYYIECRRIVE